MNSNFNQKLKLYIKNHPVTSSILIINFVMTIILLFSGGFGTPNLVRWGALFSPYVFDGNEYYRIITSMFLHGSILHFLSNSIVLYFIGAFLERLIGPYKYLFVYFLSGIISGIFVLLFSDYLSVTIGASGAIFGVIGGLLMLTLLRRSWFTLQAVKSIRQLIIVNVIITFLIPNISIPGHLGGLLAGVILFFIITPKYPYYLKYRMHQDEDNHIYQV